MITALVVFAMLIWISGMMLLVVRARMAPIGIEDENGFRFVRAEAAQAGSDPDAAEAGGVWER